MYQVGLTLYRMCNGNKFYYSQVPSNQYELQNLICSGKFPMRDKFLPHIPRKLRRIIRKLLMVDPQMRYQTILDLQIELGQVDKLLDWKYQEINDEILWSRHNESNIHEIKIKPHEKKSWLVEGVTVRKTDGYRRRCQQWCGGPFRTRGQAVKHIEGIFRTMKGKS